MAIDEVCVDEACKIEDYDKKAKTASKTFQLNKLGRLQFCFLTEMHIIEQYVIDKENRSRKGACSKNFL